MLPHDVLYRPKMGFAVPLAKGLRGPLRERVRAATLEGPLADTGWFNPQFVRQMVDQHERGVRDFATPLWTLLMFDAFLRNSGLAGSVGAPVDAAVALSA
jgi:asparagine synthase (glutamine-hydrolysing)